MKRSIKLVWAMLMLAFILENAFGQNFQLVGSGGIPQYLSISEMVIEGGYAYLATSNHGLWIIDISNPSHPVQAGQYNTIPFNYLAEIDISNGIAYCYEPNAGIVAIDVTDPVHPSYINSYPEYQGYGDILVTGAYAYLTKYNILTILDVSNPHSITPVANDSTSMSITSDLRVSGHYLYVGEYSILETYDISDPHHITLTDSDSTGQIFNMLIENNELFIQRGVFYSTGIFDLTNPAQPEYTNAIPRNDFYFAVSENNYYHFGDATFLFSAHDITVPDHPLYMGSVMSIPNNFPLAISSRDDTVFIGGNTFFNIYALTGQAKGAIAGYVKYIFDNHPIEGIFVTLVENNMVDTTDASGYFIFDGIYNNVSYSISVSHPDYYPRTYSGYTAIAGDTSIYDFRIAHGRLLDVGVSGMISPPKSVKPDSVYYVQPIVRNYCSDTISFDFVTQGYILNNPMPLFTYRTDVDSLPPGRTFTANLDSIDILPDTMYKIVVYTEFSFDENHANDTLTYYCSSETTQFEIWYGNPDGSPIIATIGDQINIDVYAKTRPDVYVGDITLNLGTNDLYIDSLMSRSLGTFHSTILQWDDYSYLAPSHSPPNPPGWSTETFVGFSDLGGGPNPWLHTLVPIKILTMVVRAANDTGFFGDTVIAFGTGLNSYLGSSRADDTVGGPGYPVTEHFSILAFRPGYDYSPGDINSDDQRIAADVTYGIRYLKGIGSPPPDSCYMDSTDTWFYPAGDVNGDCEFRGSDIVRLVAYFKSTASLSYCHFFPPAQMGR